jgi:hypothetical protein
LSSSAAHSYLQFAAGSKVGQEGHGDDIIRQEEKKGPARRGRARCVYC